MRLSVRAIVVVAGTICAVAALIGCSPSPSGDTTGAPAATGASSPILSTIVTSSSDPSTTVPAPPPPASGWSLAELRRRAISRLLSEQGLGGGAKPYAFLSYRIPDGFLPISRWGDAAAEDPGNPAVAGRFYGVAFSDGSSVIRVLVNPAEAPSSFSGTLPADDLEWTRTRAGAMQTEAYEAVRDGVDYFRIREPDDEIVVSGPQAIRPAVWETMEGVVPVVLGGGAGVSAAMPDDFAFVLRYGVMAKNVLDTGKGTFTHDMIMDPSITTDLALTPEEMAEVYERLRDIDFWAYSATLPNEVGVMPSTRYELYVRGEGLVHAVGADDIHYASSLRAVALWKLVERVKEMIEAKDAYKALPEPRGGYL